MKIRQYLSRKLSKLSALIDTSDHSPWSDYWYAPIGEETNSGKKITIEGAMAVSAVFAATRLIAESIGMIPIWIYERAPDRSKRPAFGHPVFDLLHDQPNPQQTAIEFVELMTAHAVLRGKAYAQIVPGPRGVVDQLVPLNPDKMKESVLPSGSIEYIYRKEDNRDVTFPAEEIFSLRGFGGVSVITYARESIGLALAAEEHGARFFRQGTETPYALTHPGTLSEDAQKRLKQGIQKKYGGVKNHWGILILEEGMDVKKLGLTAEDSQYIQSRKFQLGEIARWFRVPPHMLADLDRATFNNIEHLSLEFVRYTLLPWIIRWRQAIRRDLILAKQRYFADFKVEMLLLADHESRYKAYQIAIQNGILSPNEVREFENLNARNGGDNFLVPMNMTTVEARDKKIMMLATTMALQLLEREIGAVQRKAPAYANDPRGWEKWLRSFYGRHGVQIIESLGIDGIAARQYCDEQVEMILSKGIGIIESWGPERARALAEKSLLGESKNESLSLTGSVH